MKIIQLPNSTLRKQAKTVDFISPKIIKLIKRMVHTLQIQKKPPGVGLAASQVGILLKIFIIYPPAHNKGKRKIEIFINPEVLDKKGTYEEKGNLEGCLSIQGYYGPIKRANEVTVKYQTIDLENPNLPPLTITKIFTNFPAVIIQHEMDHLEGIVFIDRALQQKGKLYKLTRDEQNKEIFEEIKV